MAIKKLDLTMARRLVLAAQGLAPGQSFGSGKSGVLNSIEQLGYVQIDTISVVERAHLHTLWSRTNSRPDKHLQQLQQKSDRQIFEYWAHAAAYLPMRDFRHSIPLMHKMKQVNQVRYKPAAGLRDEIMCRLREEGPLKARNFASPPGYKGGAWWDWKPAKRMLEALFLQGELMISHREGFEKVYDLPERILPKNISTQVPTLAEQARHLILSSLRAQGLATEEEITYSLRGGRTKDPLLRAQIRTTLAELTRESTLTEVEIDGKRVYLQPDKPEIVPKASNIVQVLSPFDNLVIQRNRLRWLFNYDYRIECYLPAAKRRFGYFCLPLLQNARFLGCIDAKAHRQKKHLHIRALHLEKNLELTNKIAEEVAVALMQFAKFNLCDDLNIGIVNPDSFGKKVRAALANR